MFQALRVLRVIESDLECALCEKGDARARKLSKAVQEFYYIDRNQGYIPNHGGRYRAGERIGSGFVE